MAYCEFCAKLTVDLIQYQDVRFHPNLKSLKDSAESGCAFCGLCWSTIQSDCIPLYISELLNGKRPSTYGDEVKDKPFYPSIWLYGQIMPTGPGTRGGVESGGCVWLTCGRCRMSEGALVYFSEANPPGSPIAISLSYYAFAGSAAASVYPERCIAADPDSNLPVSFTLSRLKECNEKHSRCRSQKSLRMPTRVLDVGKGRPLRLRRTDGLCEPYVALSYCWGPSRDTLTTTNDTLPKFLVEIPEKSLTKTHQETIQLTRALGFEYLWIDALCIIQGDAKDWAFESRHMEQVYGNAALTVTAARSPDSRLGFMTTAGGTKRQPCAIPLSSSNNDVLYIDRPRQLSLGPTSTRGWCYQEELLSKRTITFNEDQMVYKCLTWNSWEDGSSNIWGSPSSPSTPVFPSSAPDIKVRKDKTLNMWYGRVEQFTRRSLSNPHDIFGAIASIAKLAHGALGSRYLAGLWEDDMARGLLWKPRHHVQSTFHGPVTRPRPTFFAPPPVVRAPSWSWASVEGPVYHQNSAKRWADFGKEGFIKIKPGLENNRWTAGETCGVDTLHMPYCELNVVGQLAEASVLDAPAGDYVSKKPRSWWKFWWKNKAAKFGNLLADAEETDGDHASLDERVVAIGVFDVPEEAREKVWCLNVIDREGLMLLKDAEQWKRVGWFVLERVSWFDGREESAIRLI
ncbi:hypothetical protein CMUS01_13960 [Colletotrichum musicola]|uniref:Heterokaryon incompatibility domain-containing protein n=1 Tax=Colletotrichum musicola TaxID=2175873 RepID=A0A8H6J8L4_9PEZI|nr:hypothetical protein CMUS01_13960 [Colletotrichum musicola]